MNSQLIKLAMITLKHSFKIVIICIIGVVFSSAKNNINTDNTISNQDPLLKKDLVSKINEAFKEGEILSTLWIIRRRCHRYGGKTQTH